MKDRLLTKNEIKIVLDILNTTYPNPECGLNYSSPFELLVSLILAAQCTDKRVNIIRPILTDAYPTPIAMSKIDTATIYSYIRSCSFPNIKSKRILEASKKLVKDFNSTIPNTMEELLTIPGIGRKSANILLTECFDVSVGIAVDTHVKRLSKRIGFTVNIDPTKIEQDLMIVIPKVLWRDINHILVTHGRNLCMARKPKCDNCPINKYCRYYLQKNKEKNK